MKTAKLESSTKVSGHEKGKGKPVLAATTAKIGLAKPVKYPKKAGKVAGKAISVGGRPVSGFAKAYSGELKGLVQENDPLARIHMVRTGVRLRDAMQVQQRLVMPKTRFYDILGLPEATMKRKERDDARLSPEQTERVLGVARLISEVERIVAESGSPDGFDAGAWVAGWMEQPVPALGGQKPAELMDTLSGQALVLDVVARMQSGAYA